MRTPGLGIYPSVLGRNACHFAPFSWYRWQAFHLMARELIIRSATTPADARDHLRAKAQLYAGYADHFLQDSFAAGHLINKTLVMQWYLEWLASTRIPVTDRRRLAAMRYERQPRLHGRDHYYPEPDEAGVRLFPRGNAGPYAGTDPQTAAEAETLDASIRASGTAGQTGQERRTAYISYLSFLSSSAAQLAAAVVHGYFNSRSLIVASRPGGPRYQIWGDRTMLTAGSTAGSEAAAGAVRAAEAASASRRVISDLLRHGGTDITSREIFESFPSHVEADGVLLTLPEWHDKNLRDQCFQELFGLRSTQAKLVLLRLISRRLGVPSMHYAALRAEENGERPRPGCR